MNVLTKLQSAYYLRKITRLLTIIIATAVFFTGFYCTFTEWSILKFLEGFLISVILCSVIAALFRKFKKPSIEEIARYLDRNYPFMEDSSSLLISDLDNDLSIWQKEKLEAELNQHLTEIRFSNYGFKKVDIYTICISILAVLLIALQPTLNIEFDFDDPIANASNSIQKDSLEQSIPSIKNVSITTKAPAYTSIKSQNYGFESIQVPENSTIKWKIETEGNTETVKLIFSDGRNLDLTNSGASFEVELKATENQIYQIAASNSDTTVFSEYLSLTAIIDQAPGFIVTSPTVIRSFISQTNKSFLVEMEVGDDYGITDVKLEATLARGSGENVRFREKTLVFDEVKGIGTPKVLARTVLNSDSLEMQPGDELYFYATATDNRPTPQIARSDTYFIIYADTAEANVMEFSGLAIDLVPEYFRSQRQLIIDTEKLLAEQSSISKKEFGDRSEIIGYDQNLLRKRYGDYLGQDDEGFSSGVPAQPEGGEEAGNHEEEHDHEEENLNGMGLENKLSEAAANIDAEFFHDHGSAEMNTLFAASPKQMLKEALANMWSAELYLRTKDPKTSLPYQYQALELLKKVQQADRQYTRKAGYKLPPIPEEEKRLTGEFDDFANPESEMESARSLEPIAQLQQLLREKLVVNEELTQKITQLVQQSEMRESDRLYILNRIRGLAEDSDNEVRQQILNHLSDIKTVIFADPSPESRPLLKSTLEN